MPQKLSTFVQQTRERETWLTSLSEREAASPEEVERLLTCAALVRGTIESIPVPEEVEERSRIRAIAYLQELALHRRGHTGARAPWYLRLGHFMRFVFTLGRRR